MSEDHYPPQMIAMLEAIWGEGFLSPGGAEEVGRVIGGHDLTGCAVLDIGCGAGGIDIALVARHGAGFVTGIDVEDPVLTHARGLVAKAGLSDRIGLVKVSPGPLPFPPGTFDVVFSKDSIIHIPDKHALMAEVFRVLRPGGWFLASDWLIGTETISPRMAEYTAAEGLDFGMPPRPAIIRRCRRRGSRRSRPGRAMPGIANRRGWNWRGWKAKPGARRRPWWGPGSYRRTSASGSG
ncbi:class I SAM-dependent methyltransferase [Fuscovulum blasticum]|uniref:class I SAM-dependent methyltransferase n=1 Tax=Fuscovulum blasticum TaxID=1075 RepID=UPI001D17C38F|nr:class I SAM-dependent methyltransferase [Fuscovulum blasticum]